MKSQGNNFSSEFSGTMGTWFPINRISHVTQKTWEFLELDIWRIIRVNRRLDYMFHHSIQHFILWHSDSTACLSPQWLHSGHISRLYFVVSLHTHLNFYIWIAYGLQNMFTSFYSLLKIFENFIWPLKRYAILPLFFPILPFLERLL